MYKTGMAEQTDVDQIRITVNQLAKFSELPEQKPGAQLQSDCGFSWELMPEQKCSLPISWKRSFRAKSLKLALAALHLSWKITLAIKLAKSQEEINEKLLSMEKWNYAPSVLDSITTMQRLREPTLI